MEWFNHDPPDTDTATFSSSFTTLSSARVGTTVDYHEPRRVVVSGIRVSNDTPRGNINTRHGGVELHRDFSNRAARPYLPPHSRRRRVVSRARHYGPAVTALASVAAACVGSVRGYSAGILLLRRPPPVRTGAITTTRPHTCLVTFARHGVGRTAGFRGDHVAMSRSPADRGGPPAPGRMSNGSRHEDGRSASPPPSSASASSLVAPEGNYPWGYLSAASAAALDEELMNPDTYGYTLEQLMELAGFAVAQAIYQELTRTSTITTHSATATETTTPTTWSALVVCGPGNNGGDGLVAARHLTLFGFHPVTIVYPKMGRHAHYARLLQQCLDVGVSIVREMPDQADCEQYSVVVDAIFGFSFQGEPRAPFAAILSTLAEWSQSPSSLSHPRKVSPPPSPALVPLIVAVDVPSGWHVEDGDTLRLGYHPHVLVSLTAPKLGARHFHRHGRRHYVGGRFVPPALAHAYHIAMPPYPATSQVMDVTFVVATHIEDTRGTSERDDDYALDDTSPRINTQYPAESWEEQYVAYLAEKQAVESVDEKLQQCTIGETVESGAPDESWELQYAAYLSEQEALEHTTERQILTDASSDMDCLNSKSRATKGE